MAVASISSSLASATASATAKTAGSGLGQTDFLNLLTTQLKYQNPLDPMKDGDFAAQLAQFSSLDNMQKLNASFSQMLFLQQMTQGANLIGKQISFDRQGSNIPARGVVQSVTVDNGQLHLKVGGNLVSLNQVRGIEASPTK